ncbi:hypothetical protein WBP06_13465 [Novosphingobium sp. BL-8H]|uniref:hypothetical protein n=1 Tax=Novosphingobium sp. BL-8H TaxID=3127640 RepID=UPI00375774A0
MSAGKWMVLMLVAGVGIGVGAANLANGGMRQWTERFGHRDDVADHGLVAFNGASNGDDSQMRGQMRRHEYNDEEGYPLEGNDGDFAYAPEPAFRQAPPGQVVILRTPGWGYDEGRSDADDGDYAEAAPRARVYVPGPQYAPSAPPRAASPAAPQQDAAAAAAERARAAAADVTAAEHGTI